MYHLIISAGYVSRRRGGFVVKSVVVFFLTQKRGIFTLIEWKALTRCHVVHGLALR